MDNVLIIYYFKKNCTYNEIQALLGQKHGIVISLSKLKRRLALLNLKRKNIEESDVRDIVAAIVKETSGAGYNLGYRALWKKLIYKYNLVVKRDTVYRLLYIVDPDGLQERFGNRLRRRQYLSPGPNFMWHIDGYDKLKPFGFAIHGCIDGFSRNIIWLHVAATNNDPKVTGYYFLHAVQSLKFIPTVIRSDHGTENSLIESLQICLRLRHEDAHAGLKSFIKGKSTRNTRIESFWGQLRKHSMDFYIQFFKCLQERGQYDGSKLQMLCLRFCFGALIKQDIVTTKQLWNEHRIRKQAARNHMGGVPYLMYNLPEKFNAQDYRRNVSLEVVEQLKERLCSVPSLVDPLFLELVDLILPNWTVPSTPEEALDLYKKIIEDIHKKGWY